MIRIILGSAGSNSRFTRDSIQNTSKPCTDATITESKESRTKVILAKLF